MESRANPDMRPGRFRASCDGNLMAEIGPNASGGTENPLGKTETGTRKVTSRPTAPNQSVMATPTCQRRRNLHGFRFLCRLSDTGDTLVFALGVLEHFALRLGLFLLRSLKRDKMIHAGD